MKLARLALVLLLAALASCARCGAQAVSDAGPSVPDAGRARVKRSVDLRTALIVAFPEYRGAFITGGRASLTRRYAALSDEAFTRAVEGNRFAPGADGGLVRGPLHLERLAPSTLVLWLPVDLATVDKVMQAPLAISSMEMGLYLPRGLPVEDERFVLELRYRAQSPSRAGFLTRQVAELLQGNGQWVAGALPDGWEPRPDDGGYGQVPERFEVTLTERGSGARLTISRESADVHLTYELLTDAAAP